MSFSARLRRLAWVPSGVDGAEPLVAVPGERDLAVRVAGLEPTGEAGLLAVGAVPEQPTDLVERVVLVAAAVQLLLLDAAADLVDDLGAELDDVDGIEDLHGVGQRVLAARWRSRNGSSAACFTPARKGSSRASSQTR